MNAIALLDEIENILFRSLMVTQRLNIKISLFDCNFTKGS